MNSTLFSLNKRDFIHGLAVAVGSAVFTSFSAALNVPGFSFSAFDWSELFRVALAAGLGFLSTRYISDENNKLGGIL